MLQVSVDTSTSGDHVIVSGIPGRRLSLRGLALTCSGISDGESVTVVVKSGSTPISGPFVLTGRSGVVLDVSDPPKSPYYRTQIGDDLVMSVSDDVAIGGTIWYT